MAHGAVYVRVLDAAVPALPFETWLHGQRDLKMA
jgi:hypothetical protein